MQLFDAPVVICVSLAEEISLVWQCRISRMFGKQGVNLNCCNGIVFVQPSFHKVDTHTFQIKQVPLCSTAWRGMPFFPAPRHRPKRRRRQCRIKQVIAKTRRGEIFWDIVYYHYTLYSVDHCVWLSVRCFRSVLTYCILAVCVHCICVLPLSGVIKNCASVHQAAKLVAAILRVAG